MKKISPIGVTEKRILIYGLILNFYSSYFDNNKKKSISTISSEWNFLSFNVC